MHAQEVGLEAGDHALLADDQREPLRLGALDRLAIEAALEADDRVVIVLGGSVFDRHERGLLVPQLLDDLLHLLVVDLGHVGREGEPAVVAQLHLRTHRQCHLVGGTDAFLEVGPCRLTRQLQHVLAGVGDGLDQGALIEVLAGLVVDGIGSLGVGAIDPQRTLDDGARRLARAEARDARSTREMPNALVDGVLEFLVGDVDLEHDGAPVAFADVGVHRILVIGGWEVPHEYREVSR